MADRPKYVPDDQREHLGDPPWKSGPELDAWEQAHGHDPRQKCIVEYGCMALAAHYEWLLDEVDRLQAELNPEAKRLEDILGDDAERIRRLRDAHQDLNKALHDLVVAYPVAVTLDRQVHNVVAAQRSINEIHAEAT